MPALHSERFGSGRPLILVHGLGSSWLNWAPVLERLAAEREVVAIDLPGHGQSDPLEVPVTVATMADAVGAFLAREQLGSADLAGNSMGARLVLELSRRGIGRNVVALDPGGFWSAIDKALFGASIGLSVALVRALERCLPSLVMRPGGRAMLLAQFSAHPSRLDPALVLAELRSYALSPSLTPALGALVFGPNQLGTFETPGRVSIGWGMDDRVTFTRQATRAQLAFPSATFHWFADAGHYPHWDQPDAVATYILESAR